MGRQVRAGVVCAMISIQRERGTERLPYKLSAAYACLVARDLSIRLWSVARARLIPYVRTSACPLQLSLCCTCTLRMHENVSRSRACKCNAMGTIGSNTPARCGAVQHLHLHVHARHDSRSRASMGARLVDRSRSITTPLLLPQPVQPATPSFPS
jgi:hypothetical protein